MKLPDWMHQKIRKGSIIPFKDGSIIPFKDGSIIGAKGSCYTCISMNDDPKYVTYKTPQTSNWADTREEVEARRVQKEIQEESFAESPVIFHGFLSIGFLGLEPIIDEPVTPTFNNLSEGQFPVTENELNFINEELEKFLEKEANEEINTTRSSGRDSQASVISLANMPMEGDDLQDPEEEQMTVCPLQDYLFGSTINLTRSEKEVKKKMTLRELFHENELSENSPDNECRGGQNINTKQNNKSTLVSVKKLLKKLKSLNYPLRPAPGEFSATSKRNNFNKILKMLLRKVHPEKNKETHYTAHNEQDGKFRQSTNDLSDTAERHNLSSAALTSGSWAENKEQWIKTDTDYFVLEF